AKTLKTAASFSIKTSYVLAYLCMSAYFTAGGTNSQLFFKNCLVAMTPKCLHKLRFLVPRTKNTPHSLVKNQLFQKILKKIGYTCAKRSWCKQAGQSSPVKA
ncbi:MAG: hypothetical protein ACYSSL_02350, partial [Planctomycetota bacterium]